MMSRTLMVATVLVAAVAATAPPQSTGRAGAAIAGASWHAANDQAPAIDRQAAQEEPGDDTRVPVQVWTVIAAVGAIVLGLVLYGLRLLLGRVPPPPSQEPGEHH